MTRIRAGTAVVLAGMLLAAGCTRSDEPPTSADGIFHDPFVPTGELRLVAYDSCEEAAEQLRAAARQHVGPWGLGGPRGFGMPGAMPADGADVDDSAGAAEAAPAVPPAAPEAARAVGPDAPEAAAQGAAPEAGAPAHSGTNVHEAGVDEPDLVKTDGRRIVTIGQGKLRVVDAARRIETGTLDLFADLAETATDPELAEAFRWVAADLLLYGDRALVLLQDSYRWLDPEVQTEPATPPDPELLPIAGPRLLLVDLTGAPRVLSEYTIDGDLVDARSVGQIVRVVVRSGPRLAFPEPDPGLDEDEQLAANQAAVDSAELSDWLPRYELTVDGDTSTGQVECTSMSRPASYTGTSMVTVLTFDLTQPAFGDGDPVTVVADGETVYSNGPSLYVANDQRWQAGPMPRIEGDVDVDDSDLEAEVDDDTVIHKFDTSDPGPPRYVASGAVEGWLINQYAMSEWDGHLRVATTSGETWWGDESDSESTVYVLAERDGELVEVGSVGGLGKGERIYSVRFAGSVGYVVTFRETDPLYTVDLQDPAAPAVLGELKITGYSAYLHPIGGGHLIGVGQEADLQGRIEGTQVSLFDVSDLADPRLEDQHQVRYGHSEAEFDPHAFLWWPAQRLLVVPLTSYEGQSGALVLQVEGDRLTERDLISHPGVGRWDQSSQIRRSLVIEDTLWTVSDAGLAAHSLSTLDRLAWLPF